MSVNIPIDYSSNSDANGFDINFDDDESPTLMACRVCGSMIDLSIKKDLHIVKCDNCKEATPIKRPLPDQKYIRCPCNCLLVCKSTSIRILCPRPSCRRIIILNPLNRDSAKPEQPIPGMCQVSCAHCYETFPFNKLLNRLALCPHCERKSSVGCGFARRRGYIYLLASLVTLLAGVTTTILTHSSSGWPAAYLLLYSSSIFFIYKSAHYFTMKNSVIVENQAGNS